MARRPFTAGNWKMNGVRAALAELDALVAGLEARGDKVNGVDCAVCPPVTLLKEAADRAENRAEKSSLMVGAQDVHAAASGAHTGDIAAEMLADAGAELVILGHSERRADHGETDETVQKKVAAAWRADLLAVLCVGETEIERDKGFAIDVTLRQLRNSLPEGATATKLAVAYEPVWAIGTGRVPSIGDISEMHNALRDALQEQIGAEADGVRLLYGGSVKPNNAAEIFGADNVDGALVGGASLKAQDFLGIIDAAAAK